MLVAVSLDQILSYIFVITGLMYMALVTNLNLIQYNFVCEKYMTWHACLDCTSVKISSSRNVCLIMTFTMFLLSFPFFFFRLSRVFSPLVKTTHYFTVLTISMPYLISNQKREFF